MCESRRDSDAAPAATAYSGSGSVALVGLGSWPTAARGGLHAAAPYLTFCCHFLILYVSIWFCFWTKLEGWSKLDKVDEARAR